MTTAFVVAGTDTGVGKTVFAAGLATVLHAAYWKPVQAGTAEPTDSDVVRRLSTGQVPILQEAYRLAHPASPHLAAEREGIEIDPARLALPPEPRPLVVEAAGGLMVPLNRNTLYLDVIARWNAPVILCARTTLGTINHSLLSIAALHKAGCKIKGIAFIGDANPDSEHIIGMMSGVARLGRLDRLDPLTPETLRAAFLASFHLQDFTTGAAPT